MAIFNLTATRYASRRLVAEELGDLLLRIEANIISTGSNASGRTIRSMEVITEDDYAALVGRKFFGTLETGRRAGLIPYGFSGIIYQWMIDKGVHATPYRYKDGRMEKQEHADRGMASAIAWKIAREGSKLHREGGRADVYSQEIPRTVERIREKMMSLVETELQSIKLNGGFKL